MSSQNIYNTNLVRQNINFDPSKVLVVDAGTLITLQKIDGLDFLLDSNRKIVIPVTVRDEVASDQMLQDPRSSDQAIAIRDWIIGNPSNVSVDENLNYPPAVVGGNQGEMAIQMYLDAKGNTEDIRVLSDDQDFVLGGKGNFANRHDLSGASGVNLTTTEYINDLFISGQTTLGEHNSTVSNIFASGRLAGPPSDLMLGVGGVFEFTDEQGNTRVFENYGLFGVIKQPDGTIVDFLTLQGKIQIPSNAEPTIVLPFDPDLARSGLSDETYVADAREDAEKANSDSPDEQDLGATFNKYYQQLIKDSGLSHHEVQASEQQAIGMLQAIQQIFGNIAHITIAEMQAIFDHVDEAVDVLSFYEQNPGGLRSSGCSQGSGHAVGADGSIVLGTIVVCASSPIVLDLDGDGLELTSLESSTTYFDFDADGFIEQTAWVGPDDAMLVIDLAEDLSAGANGSIDHARELRFDLWHEDADTDLEGLRLAFDSNSDNVLNSADDRFGEFRIWQDLNQNGSADAGELQTLSAAGVSSFSLTSDEVAYDLNGNTVFGESVFTRTNGSSETFGDVSLAYAANGYQRVDQELWRTWYHYDLQQISRPGYTIVFEETVITNNYFWLLISEDQTNGTNFSDDYVRYDLPEPLYVGHISYDYGPGYLVGTEQHYFESLNPAGEAFDLSHGNLRYAGAFGNSGSDHFYGSGDWSVNLAGGAGDDLLEGGDGDDTLSGGDGADTLHAGAGDDLLNIDAQDVSVNGGAGSDVAVVNGNNAVTLDLGAAAIEIAHGGAGDDVLSTSGNAGIIVHGGDGDDTVSGGAGADFLFGDAGTDDVNGGAGDDVLMGGGQDDVLTGGSGEDVALYENIRAQYTITQFNGVTAVLTNGSEGRDRLNGVETLLFSDETVTVSSVSQFGALKYIASYGDLINFFGNNPQAGFDHYVNHGFSEGRSAIFDARLYIGAYADLRAAFGTNQDAATAHYIINGYNEGRRTSAFDALEYIASYDDLIDAFGANAQAGLNHFYTHGFEEGRVSTFNGLNYIASYHDLIAAFGATNPSAGAQHYILHAEATGRSAELRTGLDAIVSGENGDGANNILAGNNNANLLAGRGGNDTLQGNGGDDVLAGEAGNDLLEGGAGDDWLLGGTGGDQFIFSGDFGDDLIRDFSSLEAGETINLAAVTDIDDFADLQANHLSSNADGDAHITSVQGTITLGGVLVSELTSDDFEFV